MATGQTVEADHPVLPAWNDPRAKLEPAGTEAQPIEIPDSPIQAPISSVEMETDDETFALTFDTTDLVARALAVHPELQRPRQLEAQAPKTSQAARDRGPAVVKKTAFPFMRLPREIRYKIYDTFFKANKGVFINSKKHAMRDRAYRCVESDCRSESAQPGKGWTRLAFRTQRRRARMEDPLDARLLRVNKEIWQEASQVLYGQPFTFGDTAALQTFLLQLGPRMTAKLRYVRINSWHLGGSNRISNLPAFSLLREATDLNRLEINCVFVNVKKMKKTVKGRYDVGEFLAQALYKSAHPWIDAVYYTHGLKRGGYPGKCLSDVVKISDVNYDYVKLGLEHDIYSHVKVPDYERHDQVIIPEVMAHLYHLIREKSI